MEEIRSINDNPESAILLEESSKELFYGFLLGSTDENAHKCGVKFQDSFNEKESEDLGIPDDILEKVGNAFHEALEKLREDENLTLFK